MSCLPGWKSQYLYPVQPLFGSRNGQWWYWWVSETGVCLHGCQLCQSPSLSCWHLAAAEWLLKPGGKARPQEHCCSVSNTCYHDIQGKTKESASKFLNWCIIADITPNRSPPASACLLKTLHSSSSCLILAVLPHTPPIADKFCEGL